MKKLPKKYLNNSHRKKMWNEIKKVVLKIDKSCDFSEIYVIGSMVSKKKNPNDIDFAIITKVRSKKSNTAYPIDFIILPKNEDTREYLKFFKKYMKKKNGNSFKPIKIK
jgi:hypothetical protein